MMVIATTPDDPAPPPATVVLRPATAADVPALVDIARRSWLSAFADLAPPAFVARWRARDFEGSWYPRHWPAMTVAVVAGAPVGVMQLADAEVNGLWVAPEAQGRGVGSTLLRDAERRIAAAGHERAWLTCSGFNERAFRFYLARGYVEVRRDAKVLEPGLVDDVHVMERALTIDGEMRAAARR
jgi:ribosomal protein S18 acetylase RimI-like enzyme